MLVPALSLLLVVVTAQGGVATSRRAAYLASVARCPYGADPDDVLLLLKPETHRRLSARPHELLPRPLKSNERLSVFDLAPIVQAFLRNDTIADLLDRDAGQDDVELVEADCIVKASVQRDAPWHLDRVDSIADDGAYDYGDALGSGAVVYVIDTGIRISHDDFGGRATGGFSSRCRTGSESDCWENGGQWLREGVVRPGRQAACNSHGTHCAGSVAGSRFGVAKGATVVSVQGLSCEGSASISDVIAGIQWAVEDAASKGIAAPVISMSLGGGSSASEDAAVRAAVGRGVSVVASAGNDGESACNFSPARAPEAITVAASDGSDRFASFSNHGRCVDIIAPGVSILSALTSSDSASGTKSAPCPGRPHAQRGRTLPECLRRTHAAVRVRARLQAAPRWPRRSSRARWRSCARGCPRSAPRRPLRCSSA